MNRDAIPAISAVAGLILGLTAGVVHGKLTDDDRTDVEITREVLDDSRSIIDLAEMPFADPCTLLFGDEIGKDFDIKNPGNGKSAKDIVFKSRTCTFKNGLQIQLWQEPDNSTAVYNDSKRFGRVYITQLPAHVTGSLRGANEGTLYYDGEVFYEGLLRIDGVTVSIKRCTDDGMTNEQFEKVAARVIDRLTGV